MRDQIAPSLITLRHLARCSPKYLRLRSLYVLMKLNCVRCYMQRSHMSSLTGMEIYFKNEYMQYTGWYLTHSWITGCMSFTHTKPHVHKFRKPSVAFVLTLAFCLRYLIRKLATLFA